MERSAFYVACFSTEANDIAQWRCYADDGRGVALGFNVDEFPRCNPHTNVWRGKKIEMSYSDPDFETKLKQVAEKAKAFCERKPPTEIRHNPFCPTNVAVEFSRIVLFAGLMNKHEAYRHEQEVRFLYWTPPDLKLNSPNPDGPSAVHSAVRERNGKLVGYLDVSIPKWKEKGTLTDIRLGPAAPDGTAAQFGALCAQLGIPEPDIAPSKIPYRSTRNP